eukprot:Nk52_evm1s1166 gene=Nk52_evmTU1s1166
MGKKKKNKKVLKPWCWYCDRSFEDEKILINHQKARHFKCHVCHRKLTSASGMVVHCQQVHNERVEKVPNAKQGRDRPDIEIFGMDGIPEEDYIAREEEELGYSAKRQKTENDQVGYGGVMPRGHGGAGGMGGAGMMAPGGGSNMHHQMGPRGGYNMPRPYNPPTHHIPQPPMGMIPPPHVGGGGAGSLPPGGPPPPRYNPRGGGRMIPPPPGPGMMRFPPPPLPPPPHLMGPAGVSASSHLPPPPPIPPPSAAGPFGFQASFHPRPMHPRPQAPFPGQPMSAPSGNVGKVQEETAPPPLPPQVQSVAEHEEKKDVKETGKKITGSAGELAIEEGGPQNRNDDTERRGEKQSEVESEGRAGPSGGGGTTAVLPANTVMIFPENELSMEEIRASLDAYLYKAE